jgi:serine/threonine protein kinase
VILQQKMKRTQVLVACVTRPEKLGFLPDNALVISSTPCPYCNASVSYGSNPCDLCGATLEWNALPDGFKLQYGHGLEIVRILGRGGFGVTYLANAARSGSGSRQVAVKECFPDGLVTRDLNGKVIPKPGCETEFADILRKFLLEARLLNQIKHPVSTEFLALWQANDTAYLMMEFIEGETLEARIARGSRLPEFEAIALLEPVLDLLEGVHAQKLLHRDIKPANIMLTKDGVELIDFGSVIKFDPKKSTTITSKILTPAYAPLELYGSQVRLGPSSDLYSLASSVYEAMTGVRVPSALDRSNGAIVQPLEAILNSVSRAFSKLIARALELRIDDRFGSAQEMRAALRGVPVFSKPASSTPVVQTSAARTNTTSSPKRFQMPRWALALVGIVGLIFAVNRLLAFNGWRQELEKTRVTREAFMTDQCEMLGKGVSRSFVCGILEVQPSNNGQLVLQAFAVGQPQGNTTRRNLRTDPEFMDFVYELAANALDLYDVDVVHLEVFPGSSDKNTLAQFSIDRANLAKHLSRPVSPEIRKLRAARAKKRLTMPSSETYLALVGKREVTNSDFAKKTGLKIDSLSWSSSGSSADGASMFVELPGDNDILAKDVLMFARDPAFRLGLRDMILRLHRALPGVPYIAIFVGKPRNSAVWSVSVSTYSADEFAQLAKASNAQLDDIWSFSSEYLPPIRAEGYPAESNAVNAWVIPVNVREPNPPISLDGSQNVLAVLQATEMYSIGRDKRKFQAAKQLETSLFDTQGKRVKADVIDYGNAKLLLACCPNPDQDFKLEYTALDGFCCPGSTPFEDSISAQRPLNPEATEPPKFLRLRLSPDRSNVILECDPQYGMSGLVVQVKPENVFNEAVFTDSVEAPVKETLSDCKITVPFNKFGETNTLRLLRLNFTSDSLLISDSFGKGEWAQSKKISASALETTQITRDQLIGLKRGENLEFGANLKWVKK